MKSLPAPRFRLGMRDVLGLIACSLFTPYPNKLVIWLQSKANIKSSVNMTLLQSDTVQLTCSRHQFRTDRKTQTQGIRAYSPFICNLLHTIAANIALPMVTVTIDVACVEVTLRFHLTKLATYRSSTGILTLGRPATGLRTTVCVVWNYFHKCEITE